MHLYNVAMTSVSHLSSKLKTFSYHRFLAANWLVILILGVGVVLRFYRLEDHLWYMFGYDLARDMLVAEHITTFHEGITRGPAAFGGMGVLLNSPIYFYLVSGLWLISGTPLSFMVIWAILSIGLMVLSYLVGEAIGGSRLGVILLTLTAVNPEMIFEARTFYQPYVLPWFTLLFLWFMTRKKLTTLNVCMAGICLLLPLHLHYGVLLLIPGGLVWLIMRWRAALTLPSRWRLIVLPPLICLVTLLSWVMLTFSEYPFDQIKFLFTIGSVGHSSNFQLGAAVGELTRSIWQDKTWWLEVVTLLLIVSSSLFLKARKKYDNLTKSTCVILVSIVATGLLSAFSKAQLHDIYYLSLLPIILLLFSLTIEAALRLHTKVGVVVLTTVLLISSAMVVRVFKTLPNESYFSKLSSVSQAIKTDLAQDNVTFTNDFVVGMLGVDDTFLYDGWGTAPLWLILETQLQQQLVVISDNTETANHQPLVTNPKTFYLVCEHRYYRARVNKQLCLEKVYSARNYLAAPPEELLVTDEFTLWKIGIVGDIGQDYYRNYDRTL